GQSLGRTQRRILDVQAELDRIATLKQGKVNSSVMHSIQQRFPVKVLRRQLHEELHLAMARVVRDKASVMEGNKEANYMSLLKEKRANELKERRAAYTSFCRNMEKALKLGMKVKMSSAITIKEKYFHIVLTWVREQQYMRVVVRNTLLKMQHRFTIGAFHKWKTGKHAGDDEDHEHYVIRGVGGRQLLATEAQRGNLEVECSGMISDVGEIRRAVELGKYTNKQREHLLSSSAFDETELGCIISNADMDLPMLGTHSPHAC
ncbi:unnamed protein product, partial [Chrysoparadoxa australica]